MRNSTLTLLALYLLLTHACTQPPQKQAADTHPQATISEQPSEEELKTKVAELLKQLASENYKEREEAHAQLNRLVKGIPEVIDLLKKKVEVVKDLDAKHGLEIILSPYTKWRLTPTLLRQFPDILEKLESRDQEIRKQLITELGDKKLEGSVALIIRLLEGEDLQEYSRLAAPVRFGDDDEEIDLAETAAASLAKIGKPAVEPLIELLASKNLGLRGFATVVLGTIADRKAAKALIRVLKDENEGIRRRAEWALASLGKYAIQPLTKVLKDKGENKEIRESTAELLADIGKPAVDALIEALGDDESWVRMCAAEALGDIGDKKAVGPLVEALRNKEVDVRISAAIALGEIGDKKAVEPLILALKDKDFNVLSFAAMALGKIGDKRAVEPLIEVLKGRDFLACMRVAPALGRIGDERAVEPLTTLWREAGSKLVRIRAAQGLLMIRDNPEILVFLIDALKDKDNVVRIWAASVLEEITKQDFGEDYDKWKQWYEEKKNK